MSALFNWNVFCNDTFLASGKGPLSQSRFAATLLKSKTEDSSAESADTMLMVFANSPAKEPKGELIEQKLGIRREIWSQFYGPYVGLPQFTVWPILLKPKSRGRVSLLSANPSDPPEIDTQLFVRSERCIGINGGDEGVVADLQLEAHANGVCGAVRHSGARLWGLPLAQPLSRSQRVQRNSFHWFLFAMYDQISDRFCGRLRRHVSHGLKRRTPTQWSTPDSKSEVSTTCEWSTRRSFLRSRVQTPMLWRLWSPKERLISSNMNIAIRILLFDKYPFETISNANKIAYNSIMWIRFKV